MNLTDEDKKVLRNFGNRKKPRFSRKKPAKVVSGDYVVDSRWIDVDELDRSDYSDGLVILFR